MNGFCALICVCVQRLLLLLRLSRHDHDGGAREEERSCGVGVGVMGSETDGAGNRTEKIQKTELEIRTGTFLKLCVAIFFVVVDLVVGSSGRGVIFGSVLYVFCVVGPKWF